MSPSSEVNKGNTMNINIYLEDELGSKVTKAAQALGASRNSVIREALKEWLMYHKSQKWPASVTNYKGDPNFPAFESYRAELGDPKEDPFA